MITPVWLPFAAFHVDLMVGDPRSIPHPVVIMGSAISRLEGLLNRPSWSPALKRLAGAVFAALVVGGSYGLTCYS